jgi:predicted permease
MLVYSLATANINADINTIKMVLITILTIFIATIFLIFLQFIFRYNNKEFTSLFQGSIRYNTYILVAVVSLIYKDEGLVLTMFLITFMIPFINIVSVAIFSFYIRENEKFSYIKTAKSIITNPLIIACVIGGFLNFTGIGLPILIKPIIKSLGDPAVLLGLLSVGVCLKFSSFKTKKATFWLAPILKLVCLPILAFLLGSFFAINDVMLGIIVLFCAMPTATNSYILAKQLGGDTELISAIITAEVIFSFVTLYVIFGLLLN